jgi:hypothetical protein
MPRHI